MQLCTSYKHSSAIRILVLPSQISYHDALRYCSRYTAHTAPYYYYTTALQIGAGMRDFRPHRFIVLEYLEAGTLAEKLSSGLPAGREESSYNKIVKSTKR
jgi:hypothetical protein